jgi:Caspase domain
VTKRLWLLVLCLLCGPLSSGARAAELQRVAVVVGANQAPPGRVALRYAHEDARRVADVLVTVAGFASSNVRVLLDPSPEELLAALDRELSAAGQRGGDTLLFFYYSGHADERAIFPSGKTLEFAQLKSRLEDPRAKLRVGLLDSCRGGSWTGSKGLKKVEPFEVEGARELAEEGSVLISSSSGQENAHETEALGGSYFTHYWNAGLRGAADRGGDGVVTLHEAFEYARTLTIRDTALAGQVPQHPSFQMRLSGRRDFPLAALASGRTTLLFEQSTGPVELVRLSDGLVVVETTPGERYVRLSLSAGSYLVRRRSRDGVWVRVVSLSAGNVTALKESQLELSSQRPGSRKGVDEGPAALSWRDQRFFGGLMMGVRHAPLIDPGLRAGAADGTGVFLLRASAKVAPHLWLTAPLALVYDAERDDALDYFVWGGAPVLGATRTARDGWSLYGFLGAGLDARLRHGEQRAFNATFAALGAFDWRRDSHVVVPDTWTTQLTLGVSQGVGGAVTFNLGAALSINPLVDGQFSGPRLGATERSAAVALGSVQRVGLRPLPLIQVPVTASLSIDGHVVVAYLPSLEGWVETYTAGFTYQR